MQKVKDLRTDTFTLAELDDDLVCMALLIRALPPGMEHLSQSLLLQPNLTKSTIMDAFVQHDVTTSAGFRAPESVFHTTTSPANNTPHCPTSSSVICDFCAKPGHIMRDCRKYARAKENARKPWTPPAGNRCNNSGQGSGNQKQQRAHQVAADAALDSDVVESAGNASILSYSSSDLSLPCSNLDRNTDTAPLLT